jgi:hypothetical protein
MVTVSSDAFASFMPERWVGRFKDLYPASRDCKVHITRQTAETVDVIDLAISMELPDSNSKFFSAQEMDEAFSKVALNYRYYSNRYLRPAVEEGGASSPSALMTWWLLMYSFSWLARYQPRKWTDLLNLDRPGCAALHLFSTCWRWPCR